MPVPVKHEIAKSRALKLLAQEPYQMLDAGWSGMPHSIGQAETCSAGPRCCKIHGRKVFRACSCRILRDKHDGEVAAPRIRYCCLNYFQQGRDIPSLNKLANGAGADEQGSFYRLAAALLSLRNGCDIRLVRSSCAIGHHRQAFGLDGLCQGYHIFQRRLTCAGIANIGGTNTQARQKAKQCQLLFQRRLQNRGTLETVTQGLIIEFDICWPLKLADEGSHLVPVIHERDMLERVYERRRLFPHKNVSLSPAHHQVIGTLTDFIS